MKESKQKSLKVDSPSNNDRRRMLKLLGSAGVGTVLLSAGGGVALNALSPTNSKDKIKTKARIVIAGAGAAGLTAASLLASQLDGASITLVDAKKSHFYQPGFTLIASGIKPMNYAISTTKEYVPDGVALIEEHIATFEVDDNRVITSSGQVIPYDYLIVAVGLSLNYGAIEGLEESMIGQNGIGSIYHGPEAAKATWQQMSAFADRGGIGVFLRPNSEMKCSGAPLKYTFVTEDYLTRRGTRNKSEVIYNSNNKSLFSVPIVSEKARMLFDERGIKINYDRQLKAIDAEKRIATFSTLTGKDEIQYDFIHIIPPMHAPKAIKESPLPWQTGIFAEDGWMEVDKRTLRHLRYPNVFGVGDIAGVPKGKTAASVKWQVPVAVDHIVASIAGKECNSIYNGYTSCPLITRLGTAMLVEFDYNNNLTPSFPGMIAPLEELWISWVMKTMGLKPTYISMLRGLT